MRRKRFAGALVCAGALSLTVAACGGSDASSGSGSGSGSNGEVTVYSSNPLQGPGREQYIALQNGIRLAYEEAGKKAGRWKVKLVELDSSTAQAGQWDPAQVAQNARKAAQDSSAVLYLGEPDSGASILAIPLLNQAGMAEISTIATYVGLTTSDPGSVKGEPQKYYPTGKRTFARVVPRDTTQGQALATAMQEAQCTKLAIANDKDNYGVGLAQAVTEALDGTGVEVLSNDPIEKTTANFRSYAQKVEASGADCFLFSGVVANAAVQVTKDVAAAIPGVKVFGGDGVCLTGYTDPAEGGVPKAIAPQVSCTVPALDLNAYPGGRAFLAAYEKRYGDAAPDPFSLFGYEAMKLGLDAIRSAGDKGDDRAAVLAALFATRDRESALGTYSIDENGDTTLQDYGLYKIGADGSPEFDRTIKVDAAAG